MGDMPEGTLMKHVFTAMARLGSGRGGLLFESLHGAWRCGLPDCGVCYPREKKKHNSDGATCLFLNPRTILLEWALFILTCHLH